jgi:flavin reductase (DIM6/NTAB) family NADH-FMN oxidoreductase RutF
MSTTAADHSTTTAQAHSESVDADNFKAAFRNHAGGVAVITADTGNGPVGLTATSVISVSIDPPALAFSISAQSSSTPTIREAETVVVHLLGADQLHVASLCATSGIDRFADESLWTRLETGETCFHDAHAWIRARVIDQVHVGGSTIVVVEALDVHAPVMDPGATHSEKPLVYHNRTWHTLSEQSRL